MSQSVTSPASRNDRDLDDAGSHAAGGTTDVSWKDNAIGNARGGRVHNVSWGAIFAGVVTFLAIVFLFSLLTAAAGLTGSGAGAAVVSIIGVLIAFFGAGGVAGAMAVRGGLIHGFLTWATAILATLLLLAVLTLGTAGAVGGILGNVVGGLGSQISQVQPSDVPNPTAEQTQQAERAAQQAADAAQTGATYGFFGLLLGGVVSSIGGLFGSRSVNSREAVRSSEAARVR